LKARFAHIEIAVTAAPHERFLLLRFHAGRIAVVAVEPGRE
jgi:hypothetical protein